MTVAVYGVHTMSQSVSASICPTKSAYDLLVCYMKESCMTNQKLVVKND